MKFFRVERNAALLLAFAAVAGLLVANSPIGDSLIAAIHQSLANLAGYEISANFIVSDFLLAGFFLLVGLELKRELAEGSLKGIRKLSIPLTAAVLGVALPAFFYLSVVGQNSELAVGWAIPTATDVTFALAVLMLFGSKLGNQARSFLLSFAVIDDLIAILIIAIFFGHGFNPLALLTLALISVVAYFALRFAKHPVWLIPFGLLIWFGMLITGIHPAISGVLFAMLIPTDRVRKLEDVIHPWVSFLILPIFAFTAMSIQVGNLAQLVSNLVFAAVFFRFITKTIGIGFGGWFASKLFLAKSDRNMKLADYLAIATTGGIGFTVAFLITNTVFTGENAAAAIAATLASAVIAILLAAAALSLRVRLIAK